ncbi:MAG: hypothetical protein PVSMB8_00620 [Vulcanimicrobiaceae bacterium]
MSTYGGESESKKMARCFMHRAARDVDGFLTGKHLALAGPDIGDARVLRGLGVAPSAITLLENDSETYATATNLTEGEQLIFEDVESFSFRRASEPFVHVYLDFCGNLSERLVKTVYRVARNIVRDGGVLTVGMQYGREMPDSYAARAMQVSRAALDRIREFDEDTYAASCKKVATRARALLMEIDELTERFDAPFGLIPMRGTGYIAQRETGGRTPMVLSQFLVVRPRPGASTTRMRLAIQATRTDPCGQAKTAYIGTVSHEELRSYALELEEREPGTSHLQLNLSASTVNAWKAHATRGTYANATVSAASSNA